METDILKQFNFQLTNIVSVNLFIERFIHLNQPKQVNVFVSNKENLNKKNDLSRFICELALSDNQFLCYKNSLIAAASVYLSNKLFKQKICWYLNQLYFRNKRLADESGYEESEICDLSEQFTVMLEKLRFLNFKGVTNKFGCQKYSCVSSLDIQELISK